VLRLREQCGKLEENCWTDREILVIYPAYGTGSQVHKPGRTPCGIGVTAEHFAQGPCSTAPNNETESKVMTW